MALNYLKSYIDNTIPKKPISFTNIDDSLAKATLPEIIKKSVQEFHRGSSYWLLPFLSSGHLQTAYTGLRKFEEYDHVHYKRKLITVEDKTYECNGDNLPYDRWEGKSTFTIDYVVPPSLHDPNHENFRPKGQLLELPPRTEFVDPEKEFELISDDERPLLIALHGLTGGSYESYIRSFLNQLTGESSNFDAIVINSRGCANHTITTPQLFCGLWTNDIRYLINEYILPRYPNKRIYLIGYSLGGSILANYLGQEYDSIPKNIKGSIVVASPWSFTDSNLRLSESLLGNQVYSPVMCKNLLKLINNHYEGSLRLDSGIDHYIKNPEKYNINKLKDFDDNFTSRLFGFNCADEYYRHASPSQRILKIRTPTILLNAEDDPISSFSSIPKSEIKLNPFTMLISTSIGGHIGWFDYKGDRWNSAPSARLFKELDKNWRVDRNSVKDEDLPRDINNLWQHDRILY